MVDFHTHILPNIDDGSDSINTSALMLDMMREQGVHTVVATPHFNSEAEDVETFLERRQKALEQVYPYLQGISVIPAAEVTYCRNISRVEGIEKVSLGNLRYILVEMPYQEWTKHTVDDVIAIMDNTGLTPILAHVDRYWNKETQSFFDRFLDAGAVLQLNVSAFEGFWDRRHFLRLIADGKIHLLGSDCHNMTKRPPNIKYGFDLLKKQGYTAIIEANENTVLSSDRNLSVHKNDLRVFEDVQNQ